MKDYKMIRRVLTVLVSAVLIAGCISVAPADAATAKKPSLSAKKITIAKGMKYKLKVKNKKSSVKWSSSNKKVAKVSRFGKVTGVKDGTAIIKATIKSGGKKKTLKCRVKVKTPKFKKSKYTVTKGKKLKLTIKNKYKGSSYKWKSSKKSVVKVSSKGVITGISPGKATVYATIKIPKKGNRLKKTLKIKTTVTVKKASSQKPDGGKDDPQPMAGDEDEYEVSSTDDLQSEEALSAYEPDSKSGSKRKSASALSAEEGELVSGAWDFVRCSWDEDEIKVKNTSDTCRKAFYVSEAGTNWTSGWYVLDQTFTVDERIEVSGNVHLILTDGNTLYADKGIKIGGGSTLNIYGQSKYYDDCGKLIANRNKLSGVGIGTASAGDSAGSLFIHGGNIEAYGGKNDAGIGSGDKKDCIDIHVYAGKIKAEGGTSAAGIGDGRGVANSGYINLYGGKIDAYGGHYAAGIGGGNRVDGKGGHHGKTIRIYNCKVHAWGGDDGAGIGGGEGGNCGEIIICGQSKAQYEVFAYGGNNGAGIGNGECESTGDGGTIWILDESFVDATGGGDGAGIGGGDNGRVDSIEIEGGMVKAYGGQNAAGIGGGNDADGSGEEIRISDGIVLSYGKDGAGIGGGEGGDGRNIIIDGGEVYAFGGGEKRFTDVGNGAGIGGGGHGGDGGNITINGGIVHGESVYGAGIGGGRAKEANDRSGKGGNITINGGDITAIAFTFGIGCGASEQDDIDLHRLTMNSIGHFVMNGGVVKAYGKAAGVGARNGVFDMKGGTLTADGRGKGAGMWFTYDRDDHDIAHINFTGGTTYVQGYKEGGLMTGSDAEEGNFNEIKISGKNTEVYVSCTGEESGIGGRRMGPIVKIAKGATVNVKTKSDWSKSIGGHYGLFKTGPCTVYDEAKVVLKNRSETPVPKGERSDACHYKDNSYDLWVMPCDHPNQNTYKVTKDGEHHYRTCKYCKTSFPEENHVYDSPDDVTCSVCGYVYTDPKHIISFSAGDGSGKMEQVEVAHNYEYTLPECSFTAPSEPEGSAFYKWQVQIGETGEIKEYKPGEAITISDHTVVTALWKVPCKVTFKTGDKSETYTQDVMYGDPIEEPIRPVKPDYAFRYWRLEDGSPDTPYDFETEVTEDITLVAEWSNQPVTIISLGCDRDDKGNVSTRVGSVDMWPDTVVPAGTKVTLTTSVSDDQKNIYEFDGWYRFTDPSDGGPFIILGEKLKDASDEDGDTYDVYTSDSYPEVRIAAVYRKKTNGYTILTLDPGMSVQNGYVEVEGENLRPFGDGTMGYVLSLDKQITLDVHPREGSWPETIYYTYDYYYPGSDIPERRGLEIDPDSEGNYTFTPPATNITLHATYDDQTYTLAASTTDSGCLAPVGDVTISPEKDTYRVHDQVTVSTEEAEGYDFLGWYPVTEVTDGQVSAFNQDSPLSDQLTYSFEFGRSNEEIAAVFRPQDGTALVKVVPVNGAEFKAQGQIDSSAADDPETIYDQTRIFTVPIGENLKLTANDADSVLQWENESHKILGSGANLDQYVSSKTTIYLVYKADHLKQSYLQFVSDFDQVLSYKQIKSQSDIAFPVIPSKIGHTFENWVFEGTEDEATEDKIWARNDQKMITVRPKYSRGDDMGKVSIYYMARNRGHHKKDLDILIGDTTTLTPPKIDGYKFKCWEDDDGNVLGYTKDYQIKVSGDREILCCYDLNNAVLPEPVPVITLSSLNAVEAGDVHKVRGVTTRSIPDGYTLVETGVLYAFDSEIQEEQFVYTDGANGIKRYVSAVRDNLGTVALNARMDSDSQNVSIRGYMLVRDPNGEVEWYYTDKKDGSYESLK